MDNRFFNVNGRSKEQLTAALKLLLSDEYGNEEKVGAWSFSEEKGFILHSYSSSSGKENAFPIRMSADSLAPLLWEWLQSKEAKTVHSAAWEEKLTDFDGSCELGWRLYTEDWGHIKSGHTLDHSSIAALKPMWLWYGK